MIGSVTSVGTRYYDPWIQRMSGARYGAVQAGQRAQMAPAGRVTQAASGRYVAATAIPAAQTGVPVQAVDPVRPAPAVGLDMDDILRRLDTDPAAMAVRGRIQYLGQETEAGAGGEKPELPALGVEKSKSAQDVFEEGECQTCKERKYKDGSDDMGVSFKTPAHIAPEAAASRVRGHEYEHVTRERAKADRENREIISQSVTYRTAICPECGRVYVAGGMTRTVTAARPEPPANNSQDGKGGFSAAA